MKKALFIISLLAIATISLEAQAVKLDETYTENSTLATISAEASVKAEPNIATISAGVETEKPTAERAFNENSNKMKRIFKALKAAGIEDKNIKTSSISLYPYRQYNKHLDRDYVKGYRARNTVTVTFRDMKVVGKVIDALISQGANNLNGPNFSIENSDKLKEESRVKAMKKAMAIAEDYAKTAGLKVKRIVRISENSRRIRPNRPVMMRAMSESMGSGADATPTPISAGEEEVNTTIRMEVELVK